jgi:transcriptional regulator with XRE-family HTH domain
MDALITSIVIIGTMSGSDVRDARQQRRWTQADLARRLGVSQAYVCLLERERRPAPGPLAEKLVKVLGLSPVALPVRATVRAFGAGDAAGALGALGHPGFAYVRGRRWNPAELLVRVLGQPDVDARVVEALPWLLLRYPNLDWTWLLREAKANDLQNRLGFLLAVSRELAELRGELDTARTLAAQERALEGSRLQREGSFRSSMTAAEQRWLRQHRPAVAAEWNVLSTMTATELVRAS